MTWREGAQVCWGAAEAGGLHEIVADDLVRCRVLRFEVPLAVLAQDASGESVDVDDPGAEDWFCGGCGDRVATMSRRG